jgi:hypothetical protein
MRIKQCIIKKQIKEILEHPELTKNVMFYMASKSAGDDYDNYEDNKVYTNLNPITLRLYVKDITPEALVWKQYGLHQVGAKEILCDKSYRTLFEKCNRIVIDGIDYQVFREGTGNRTLIIERPMDMIRVVVSRNG